LQAISSCCRMNGPPTGRHLVATPLPAAPTTGACGVPCVGSARWTASSKAQAAANAAAVNALSSWATESEDDSEREDDLHQQLHLRRPDQADLFTRVSTGKYLFQKQPVQLKILRSTLIVTGADGKDAPIDAFLQANAASLTSICDDGWPPEPPALPLDSPLTAPSPVPGASLPTATQMPWPAQACESARTSASKLQLQGIQRRRVPSAAPPPRAARSGAASGYTGKAPTSKVATRRRSTARSRGHSSASPSPGSQTPSSPTTSARRWPMAARSGSASRRAATARVGGA